MKVVVIGTGTVGQAVAGTLSRHGHDVVSVGRTSGMLQADITDSRSLETLFETVVEFDAVVCAAGDVFPGPLAMSTAQQWDDSIAAKGRGRSTSCARPFRTSPTTDPSR